MGGNTSYLYTTENAVANVSGGTLGDIIGDGGTVNIQGGIISNNTLYNLHQTTFNLFGTFATPANGQLGIYDDGFTVWSGVYWDLSGTFANLDVLDTRYFEAGGNLRGPNFFMDGEGLHLLGAITPEPGTIALLLLGGIPFICVAYRRTRTNI